MSHESSDRPQYKVSEWDDVEHCVYHALTDAPENLTSHRIARLVSRFAATLVEKRLLTTEELEVCLHSARG